MNTNFENADKLIDSKMIWITPDIIELSIKSTSTGGSYNDDGSLAPTLS